MYAIGQIQKRFHQALSDKDIELMMTVWAPNATITVGPGQTLAGTEKIRDHGPTRHPSSRAIHWVSDSPIFKTGSRRTATKGRCSSSVT